jgi:hypothetical protein
MAAALNVSVRRRKRQTGTSSTRRRSCSLSKCDYYLCPSYTRIPQLQTRGADMSITVPQIRLSRLVLRSEAGCVFTVDPMLADSPESESRDRPLPSSILTSCLSVSYNHWLWVGSDCLGSLSSMTGGVYCMLCAMRYIKSAELRGCVIYLSGSLIA